MRTILVAAVCAAALGAQDYFPLEKGNRWTYRMSDGQTMTTEVTGFEDVGGVRCAALETTLGPQKNVDYIAADAKGVKAYKISAGGQELVYAAPIVRVKLPYVQGDTWTASVEQGGVTISTAFESTGGEKITVPAGTFETIVVRGTISSSAGGQVVAKNWFAAGVGLVRQSMELPYGVLTADLTETNVKPRPAGPEHASPVGNTGGEPAQPTAGGEIRIPPTVGGAMPQPNSPQAAARTCTKCGEALGPQAKFCERCGTKAPPPAVVRPTACPKCGAALTPTAKFCAECGEKIEGVAPPPAAGPSGAQARAGERPGTPGPELERYRSEDGRLLLFRPKGWNVEAVEEEGVYRASVLEPEENAGVIFATFPVREDIKDSVVLAARLLEAFKGEFENFAIGELSSSPDRARTIANVSLTVEGKQATGHAYFFHTQRLGTMYLLLARRDLWEGLRPTLVAVAANFAYAPGGVEKVLAQGRELAERMPVAAAGASPAAILQDAGRRPGKQLPLREATLADGSMACAIPQGWSIEGQGLQYLIFDDPRARLRGLCSVWHTIIPGIQVPGGINSPYQPPPQTLALLIEAGSVGTGVEILGECPAEGVVPEATEVARQRKAQGFNVDVRLLHVRFTSKATGKRLRGLFTVDCSTQPMGVTWTAFASGGWAPEEEFDDLLPLYLRLLKTMRPNETWLGQTLARQNARQLQLNRNLQNSIAEARQASDDYLDSLRNASRSRDYQSWAQSQTTLGQGTWVAENEGGRVYETDSWGIQGSTGRVDSEAYNTTNFTGESPWGGNLERVDTRDEYERHVRGQ